MSVLAGPWQWGGEGEDLQMQASALNQEALRDEGEARPTLVGGSLVVLGVVWCLASPFALGLPAL